MGETWRSAFLATVTESQCLPLFQTFQVLKAGWELPLAHASTEAEF